MSTGDVESKIVRVELPFNRALGRAARQNFDLAVRKGKVKITDWGHSKMQYISDARALLLRDGENQPPCLPDVEHIVLKPRSK